MNSPLPASGPARRNWTRRLVNLLVALVVIAVAAAAFVFSYDGVHAIALFGGVSEQLARYYPGLFDAVLVIACVAAVMLRDGQWWSRLWAWVVIIVILAAIGTTDVLHAMNYTLRHRPTEGIVAAAPVVAVLLAFSLLLTLLRQSRTPAAEPAAPAPLDVPALPAGVSAPPIALPAAPAASATAPTQAMRAAEDWTVPEWPKSGAMPTREVPAAAAPPPPPAARAVPLAPPPSLTPPAEAGTGPVGRPVTEEAPVREDHVVAAATELPPASPPELAHPATQSNKAIISVGAPAEAPHSDAPASAVPAAESNGEAPTAEVPSAGASPAVAEPAAPTVQIPALSAEPASEKTVPVRRPHGIRYAGNGVPGMAGKQQAAERDAPSTEDYWDAEEAAQFAGLVYPARGNEPDLGDHASDADDSQPDKPSPRKNPQELDLDAPPFATAPFAPGPRLNRVRSTPTPPAEPTEEEEEEEE